MPLFEYRCGTCGHAFEELVQGDEQPACPKCASVGLEKLLSGFAVGGPAGPDPASFCGPAACGTCGDPRGPGACSMN